MLSKEFNFYNARIFLEMKEKEKLAGLDILNDFREMLNEKDFIIEEKNTEINSFRAILGMYQKSEIKKDAKIFD